MAVLTKTNSYELKTVKSGVHAYMNTIICVLRRFPRPYPPRMDGQRSLSPIVDISTRPHLSNARVYKNICFCKFLLYKDLQATRNDNGNCRSFTPTSTPTAPRGYASIRSGFAPGRDGNWKATLTPFRSIPRCRGRRGRGTPFFRIQKGTYMVPVDLYMTSIFLKGA